MWAGGEIGIGALRAKELQRVREICRDGMQAGHGAVVFLAGPPGSGRTAVLQELESLLRLEAARPQTVRGAIADGAYVPAVDQPGAPELRALIERALGVAANALPVLGLLAQLLGLSRAAQQALRGREPSASQLTFGALFQTLRLVANERPTVCLVDDCDEADGRWWSELLLGLSQEIAHELPLFFVLVVQGGDEPGPHAPEEPDAMFAARHLTGVDLAEWLPLLDVEPDDLVAITGPADRDTVLRLAELAEGRPGWASEAWREWRTLGVVERDTDLGPWRFAPGQPEHPPTSVARVARTRIQREFGDDLKTAHAAWDLLACGAIEGRYFTGEVVAAALERDAELVMDLLDDHLLKDEERRPHGLVEEAGWLTVTDKSGAPVHLSRYRFTSHPVRSAFLRYGLSAERRRDLMSAVARALEGQLGPAATPFAGRLSHLYGSSGHADRAAHWRGVAHANMPTGALVEQARKLFDFEPDGADRATLLRACHILLDAARVLTQTGALSDVRIAGQRAAILARHANSPREEARALEAQADAEVPMGMPESAQAHLEAACAIFRARGDRSRLGGACSHLAQLCGYIGDRQGAIDGFDEAIAIFRELDQGQNELRVRSEKTEFSIRDGDVDGGLSALVESVPLLERFGDDHDFAVYYVHRAQIAGLRDQNGERARCYRRAAEFYRKVGDSRGESHAMCGLGSALTLQGKFDEAGGIISGVIVDAQARDDAQTEAAARRVMAAVFAGTGRAAQAVSEQRRSLDLDRYSGGTRPEFHARLFLVDYLVAAGDEAAARRELTAIVEGAKQAGHDDVVVMAEGMLEKLR